MAAGYLLGRFKKLRLALIVGSAFASEDARNAGAKLLMHGPMGLAAPAAKKAGKGIGSQLLDAGRTAAISRAGSRIDSLSSRINERTVSLQGEGARDEREDEEYDESDEYDEPEDESEDEPEDEYEDEPEDEYEDEPEDEPEDDEVEDNVPRQRSPRRSRSASPAGR